MEVCGFGLLACRIALNAAMTDSEPLLQQARAAAREVAERSRITVSESAIDAFIDGLDEGKFEKLRTGHGPSLPLRFDSYEERVNVDAVMSLLNAFSSFRAEFHDATGRGAYDNMSRIVLAMFLTPDDDGGPPVSAKALQSVKASQLAEWLGVSMHTEEQHPTLSFVTVGKREAPLNAALELVARTCKDAGNFVEAAGFNSLGAFVVDALGASLGTDAFASDFLRRMAAVPGFNDYLSIDGTTVYIMKKALYLLYTLMQRSSKDAAAGDAPNIVRRLSTRCEDGKAITTLPMFVDNVIPTMLVHAGILDLSESSIESLRGWDAAPVDIVGKATSGPEMSTPDAYRIRAAALYAGELIARRAHEIGATSDRTFLRGVAETDLDGYLWSVAKEEPLRSIPRLREPANAMY